MSNEVSESVVRRSIMIDDDMWEELRQVACDKKTSISRVIRLFTRQGITKHLIDKNGLKVKKL